MAIGLQNTPINIRQEDREENGFVTKFAQKEMERYER